jgi:hypothetical protein
MRLLPSRKTSFKVRLSRARRAKWCVIPLQALTLCAISTAL